MTAEILRLSGLDDRDATAAAQELLADRARHPVLRRMLVVDDTAALFDHSGVYQLLLTSNRMEHLLCVAVGPPGPASAPGREPKIRIPPNISSQQGSAVLWVGDPHGVDVSLTGRLADGHQGALLSGLDYLLMVLLVNEIFDKVLATLRSSVHNGVANPGLHLAGADDEAVSFTAALTLATRRITGPGTGLAAGAEGPYPSLLPADTGTVTLDPNGELARYRDRVVQAAAAGKRRGGVLHRDRSDPRDDVIAVGADLRAFRERVTQLFTAAQSTGEPTQSQRDQITAAGVLLPTASTPANGQDNRPLTAQAVGRAAVRNGETLPKVIRRLTLTAKQLKHEGSASHQRDVDQACPQTLAGRLLGVPPRPAGKAAAEAWQHGLGLADAARAADALAALVVEVARTEWAVGPMRADEVTRTKIVLDGICKQLAEHVSEADPPTVSGAQAARITRLSESLAPILFDLVDRVLTAEEAAPSPGGQQAYDRARAKTGDLLAEWLAHVAGKGDIFRPPFATSVVHDSMYVEDDVAVIRETLQHDARRVMWQLCGPTDLWVLKPTEPLSVVAFAPQRTKEALGVAVPQDMTWTGSGSHAGLLRLVPLRPSAIWAEWADGDLGGDLDGEAVSGTAGDVLSEAATEPWP